MFRLYLPGHSKLMIPAAWTCWTYGDVQYAIIDHRLFSRPSPAHVWSECYHHLVAAG